MLLVDPQFDHYRLFLLCASTRRVLLDDTAHRPHLPEISVPRWTRAAKEIIDLIRQRWQFHGIVLDFLGDRPGSGGIVIVEALDCKAAGAPCPDGHRWGCLDEIGGRGISDRDRNLLRLLTTKGATGRGAFSRLGWIEEAIDWISQTTAIDRSRFLGGVQQLNGSANSSLVRFAADDGRSYWFKAAGSPGSREARITARLAALFPEYLPQIVGFHREWNAWLMRDAGTSLSLCDLDESRVNQVVRSLAELQRISVRHVPELLGSGCHDHRMAALRAEMPELTPYLQEAMSVQDIATGTRVSPSRLRRVASLIEEASIRLEDIGIPDALVHCDIDLQNVLIDSAGCVFTDWADASVGNPFATFEQIRIQFAQADEARASIARMNESYYDVWRDVITNREFQYALTLTPLIALASNLCCRRDWLTTDSLHRSQSQSYARVLARQMDRAAQVIEHNIRLYA